MQTLSKIIAAMFAILLIIVVVAALFLFNLERKAFSPATYQDVFANGGFYDRLPGVMTDALLASTNGSANTPLILRGIPRQDLETFLRTILPPEVLKPMGDDTIRSIFAYVNRQADSAQASLTPLKTSLTSATSVQAVYGLLSNQPPCTTDQLLNMATLLLQQQLALCNPPAELQSLITPVIQLQLQTIASVLPDSVTLISSSPQQGLADPREQLSIVRSIMGLSPLIALGVLFIYFVLIVLSFVNWLDWLGVPFILSGGFSFVTALIGSPVIRVLLQGILARNMPRYVPAILLDYAGDIAGAVTRQFLQPVIWEGLLLVVLGIGILVLSFIFKQRGRAL